MTAAPQNAARRIALAACEMIKARVKEAKVPVAVTRAIQQIDITPANHQHVTAQIPTHQAGLEHAIKCIPPELSTFRGQLLQDHQSLHWRTDDGRYYEGAADVGQGYRTGNIHALLVGPSDSPIQADDLLVGLFFLAPGTLYRDHKHLAPEIYIPLTGPQGWRFDQGSWTDLPAGTVIYNPPNMVHATRVYQTPFLALFAWTRDVISPCEVVPAPDWDNIEKGLNPK